jgi:hypothetical protein
MAGALRSLTVVGYHGCSYFDRAAAAANKLAAARPTEWQAVIKGFSRSDFLDWLKPITAKHGVRHTSSPIVFIGTPEDGEYIGGCDATLAWAAKNYPDVRV